MLLVHVIFHVTYFKRDRLKRNFGQPCHLHYLCWSSNAPPILVQQKFKFLASSIVQVCVVVYQMWCCQCVFSAGHTHCWNASRRDSQCLISGMAEVIQDCVAYWGLDLWACTARLCGMHLFCLWAALCSSLSRWQFVLNSIRECWKQLLVHSNCL